MLSMYDNREYVISRSVPGRRLRAEGCQLKGNHRRHPRRRVRRLMHARTADHRFRHRRRRTAAMTDREREIPGSWWHRATTTSASHSNSTSACAWSKCTGSTCAKKLGIETTGGLIRYALPLHTFFRFTTHRPAIRAYRLERMTQLYLDNYEGSSKTLFTGDLSTKDEVLLLFADDDLVGSPPPQYVSTIDGRHTPGGLFRRHDRHDKERWGQ